MTKSSRGSSMPNNEEMSPVDRNQEDIIALKQDVKTLKDDVHKLQLNDISQDSKITNLQTTLSAIQDDTNWIRRKITGAFITALITAIVAGVVGVAVANIF